MRAAALSMLAVLASCSAGSPEAVSTPTPTTRPSFSPVLANGWSDVWTTPQPVLDTFARLSFRPSAYEATGTRFRSESRPSIVLADPAKGAANSFALVAEGTADRLDTLRFALSLTDASTAEVARKRFVEQLQMAFRQLGAPGADAVAAAVAAETPAEGEADGARWTVTRKPLADEGRLLTVTFTAPDATGTAS